MVILRKLSTTLLLSILLLEFILLLLIFDIFQIRLIILEGYFNPILLEQGGENIFLFNLKELEMTIIESDPTVKKVFLTRKYPQAIKISVERRQPKFLVTDREEKEFFVADSEGVVFKRDKNIVFSPILVTNKISIKIGSRLSNSAEVAALKIINSTDADILKLKKLVIKEDILEAQINNIKVIFKREENYFSKLATLQLLLKRFTIEGKKPKKIDLRFEKPIITS